MSFTTCTFLFRYLGQSVIADKISSDYNPKRKQVSFKMSSKVSQKYKNKCPPGFKLEIEHSHCTGQ